MRFPERIHPPLKALATKLIEAEMYSAAKSVCDLLAACKSGRWHQISSEEQKMYLTRYLDLFHARCLGDTEFTTDPDYRLCSEIIHRTHDAL